MTNMMVKRRLLFRPKAEVDLAAIYHYSCKNFGTQKADTYIQNIFAACERICVAQSPGRERNDIRQGVRVVPANAHRIFFEIHEQEVIVIRVLHQQMDIALHMPSG